MPFLTNVEIFFTKVDPKRPSKQLTPANPTWETQIRTTDKEVRKKWMAMNIKTKAVREDKDDEESKILYYSANLKKKSLKKDGTPNGPVEVINGKGEDLDPNSIGNGSVANLRIFQHDYVFEGIPGIATVLMGMQIIKHVVYVQQPMEEFGKCETETVMPTSDAEGSAPGNGGATTAAEDDDY